MKEKTIKKIGGALGLIGCITADIAATAILKNAAPCVNSKLHKYAISAGIAFIGMAVGSQVEKCVNESVDSYCNTMKEVKGAIDTIVGEERPKVTVQAEVEL